MRKNISAVRCVVALTLMLPLAGCSLFRGQSKGTTEVKTANGSLPIRREASAVVDLAQPTVVVDGDRVVVTGNVRLRDPNINPDARVQISVIDRYGKLADRINAKLVATEKDQFMSYSVKFGPVPARGSSLLVAYDDFRPIANYSSEYIGSGGAGGSVSGGGGQSITTNRRTGNSGSVVSRGAGKSSSRMK